MTIPRILSVINQKGGVGKTTTAVNLAAALARRGRRVLLIDLDPQTNLTTHLGIDPLSVGTSVYELLCDGRPLAEAVVAASEPGLTVAPATVDLAAAEMELVPVFGREFLLRNALRTFLETSASPPDTVIIDCAPSLGLLAVNALTASGGLLIPMQAEFFALQGIAKLLEVVDLVKSRLNPDLCVAGIVLCRVDRRTKLSGEVQAEIRRYWPSWVLDTAIRPNVKLAEAPSFGQTIFAYAPDSTGAEDYAALARELLAARPGSTERQSAEA